MAKNKKGRIPKAQVKDEQQEEAKRQLQVRASTKDMKVFGLVSEEIGEYSSALNMNPYVVLKYFKSDWQCFSDWESWQLKQFSGFLKSLAGHTWQQVYRTGSKIPKHGLGYTRYDVDDVKSSAIRNKLQSVADLISEDISFFELRVNQSKLRVHGFQSHSAFFLVVLDKDHEAFPM